MSPAALLERLSEVGVTVRLSGPGRIALSPVALIPDELRPEVVAHKAELAALVERQPRTWQAKPSNLAWPSVSAEDPRPDLVGTELWAALLRFASGDASDPHGVYGRLHGFRCCGAVLEPYRGSWRLAPTIDPSERVSIWHSRESWDRDCSEWLRPHVARLRELLAQVPMTSPRLGQAPDG